MRSTARVLTVTNMYEHITPFLRSLHWLPVKTRIDFKIMLHVYKALNGLAPHYIKYMLIRYEPAKTPQAIFKPSLVLTLKQGRLSSVSLPQVDETSCLRT